MGKNVVFRLFLLNCDVLHQIYCTHLGEPRLRAVSAWLLCLLCVQDLAGGTNCTVLTVSSRKDIEVRRRFPPEMVFDILEKGFITPKIT